MKLSDENSFSTVNFSYRSSGLVISLNFTHPFGVLSGDDDGGCYNYLFSNKPGYK